MEVIADEHKIQQLYKASVRGYVATLKTLIRRCPEILLQVPVLTSSGETPLHISAALGHFKLTKHLLRLKPNLVSQFDSSRSSPLHLASAEGHKKIVKELLKVNSDVCLRADQDGRIPLHLAAIKGRVAVIRQLIRKKPESITEKLHGDTVLHLCVKYSHLDALKLLMSSITDEVFLNSTDNQGNTIFHLSVILEDFQITDYLLSQVPRIRVDVESLVNSLKKRHSLDVSNGTTENNLQFQASLGRTETVIQRTRSNSNATRNPKSTHSTGLLGSLQSKLNKPLGYKSDQYEDTRGHLIVVATLIAQMSFQVATNPPGGYWQTDNSKVDNQGCQEETCKAGTSILAYSGQSDYHRFIASSTLSFVVSLGIILLLISRFPLRSTFTVAILVSGIWTSVLLIAAAYIFSMRLVQVHNDQIFYRFFSTAPTILAGLIVFLLFYHIVQSGMWLIWDKQIRPIINRYLYPRMKNLMNWIRNSLPRTRQQDTGSPV